MFLLKDVFLLKISFCVYFASKKFPRISQKTAMVLTNVSLQEYLKICRSDRWNYLGMLLTFTKANVWQLTSATFSLEFQHYTGSISIKPLWVKLSFQLKSSKTKNYKNLSDGRFQYRALYSWKDLSNLTSTISHCKDINLSTVCLWRFNWHTNPFVQN